MIAVKFILNKWFYVLRKGRLSCTPVVMVFVNNIIFKKNIKKYLQAVFILFTYVYYLQYVIV